MDERVSFLAVCDVVRYWSVRRFPRFWQLEPRSLSAQEILVDGHGLPDIFDLDLPKPSSGETVLRTEDPGHAVARLERLMGLTAPDLSDGKVALLARPGGLEAGGGALSVKILRTDSTVTWTEAGWQDGAGNGIRPVGGPRQLNFSRGEYETALAGALGRWRQLPRRPGGDSPAFELMTYPVLAIDDEGAVRCFEARDELEGLAEMFMHGEFALVVDAMGLEYSYAQGDLPYIELTSRGLANEAGVLRSVEKRRDYLRACGALRQDSRPTRVEPVPGESLLAQAFSLARVYTLD